MDNKDLIAQYVDTGLSLSEHQVSKLPSWALKSYLRKRLIAIAASGGAKLKWYEVNLLSEPQQEEYLHGMVDRSVKLTEHEYNLLDEQWQKKYLDNMVDGGYRLAKYEFDLLDKDIRDRYLISLTSDDFAYLLRNIETGSPDKTLRDYESVNSLIDYYLDNDLMTANNYSDRILSMFFQYYKGDSELINKITDKYLDFMGPSLISEMVFASTINSNELIDKIINNHHTLYVLRPKCIEYMLQKSSDPEGLMRKFLSLRQGLADSEVAEFLRKGMPDYWDGYFFMEEFFKYFKDEIRDEQIRNMVIGANDRGLLGGSALQIVVKVFGQERADKIIPPA